MADPHKREQWREWQEEFQRESDRACAVLAAAFLDEQLRALLEAFFVDDVRVQDLFDASGPLASFSSRIALAHALGFLAASEVRDLDLIRKIRNDFAHELHGTSFGTPAVASRCKELKRCDVMGAYLGPLRPRDRFVISVVFLATGIAMRRLAIRDSRRTIQPEVKRAS